MNNRWWIMSAVVWAEVSSLTWRRREGRWWSVSHWLGRCLLPFFLAVALWQCLHLRCMQAVVRCRLHRIFFSAVFKPCLDWKKMNLMNSNIFVLFGKYCPIVDQLGSKDSSRDFQLNCVINYFFTYIYYFMHGSKDWCDGERVKKF
jgi:hypothetical protein